MYSKSDEVKGNVLSDLESLKQMADKLNEKLPEAGVIDNESYLSGVAIHILSVSQLEYFLKSVGKIKQQFEMLDVIETTQSLTRLEKDNLIYLVLTRHPLVHNGGYFDAQFNKEATNRIKQLKINIPSKTSLSVIDPRQIKNYIGLVEKFIGIIHP